MIVHAAKHFQVHPLKINACIQDEQLTAQIFPCSVIFVMNPLSGVRVEVGLGRSVAQRVVTDPYCQVNVKHLWGDQTLCIHQLTGGQLEEDSKGTFRFYKVSDYLTT